MIVCRLNAYPPSHDKLPRKPKKLYEYPLSTKQDTVVICGSRVVRNGDNYELRNGTEIVAIQPYKKWFIAELRNSKFVHLNITKKSDALKYCVDNVQNWVAIYFDEQAIERILVGRLTIA